VIKKILIYMLFCLFLVACSSEKEIKLSEEEQNYLEGVVLAVNEITNSYDKFTDDLQKLKEDKNAKLGKSLFTEQFRIGYIKVGIEDKLHPPERFNDINDYLIKSCDILLGAMTGLPRAVSNEDMEKINKYLKEVEDAGAYLEKVSNEIEKYQDVIEKE
jgi:hypothetical protein